MVAAVEAEPTTVPARFALEQNYPNPFNPSSVIEFTVHRSGSARLTVFDALGRDVATLFDGHADAGKSYTVTIDASVLTSGVYCYRLTAGEVRRTRSMIVLR